MSVSSSAVFGKVALCHDIGIVIDSLRFCSIQVEIPEFIDGFPKGTFKEFLNACNNTSSSRASRGRKFQVEKHIKKPISQRKNLPMECAQGHQPVRCPNRVCCVHQPSAVPPGVGVLVVASCVSVLCWWW